jgi:hypothetical protein
MDNRESYFDSFHQTPHGELKNTYYNPFMVKHRRRTSKMQLRILEKTFETNIRPDANLRKILGEQLGMTPRSVQVWFQNRRAKIKKNSRKNSTVIENNKGNLIDNGSIYDECSNAGLYKKYEPIRSTESKDYSYSNSLYMFTPISPQEIQPQENNQVEYLNNSNYNNNQNSFMNQGVYPNTFYNKNYNDCFEKEDQWINNNQNTFDDINNFDTFMNN